MIDYGGLYQNCVVSLDPLKVKELLNICSIALQNKDNYLVVSTFTKIPWPVIAAIHFRESNQSFNCHLHNGDPLTARTVHVPAGRPITGTPSFTWCESAVDALTGIWRPSEWSIAQCLEFSEKYNGTGYQKHGVNTPYVWDYTNQYTKGLYVSDGSFDENASESRPGVAAILKTLNQEKGVSLDFTGNSIP